MFKFCYQTVWAGRANVEMIGGRTTTKFNAAAEFIREIRCRNSRLALYNRFDNINTVLLRIIGRRRSAERVFAKGCERASYRKAASGQRNGGTELTLMPGMPRNLLSLERFASTSARAACSSPSAVLRSAIVTRALFVKRRNSYRQRVSIHNVYLRPRRARFILSCRA